ncbi:MAG: VIT domain-containing protein [Myxococcota bacterium]
MRHQLPYALAAALLTSACAPSPRSRATSPEPAAPIPREPAPSPDVEAANFDAGSAPAATAPPISLTAGNGQPLRLARVSSESVVRGPIAFTEVRMAFENPAPRTIEGRFQMLLPPGASVSRFAMRIGSQWQEGEMVEKKRARTTYETFLHRRVDPALLEQGAANRFAARVFPIAAGATKEIVLSYSQEVARPEQTLVELRGLKNLPQLDVRVARKGKVVAVPVDPAAPTNVTVGGATASGIRHGRLCVARVTPSIDADPVVLGDTLVLVDTSASRALDLDVALKMAAAIARRVADAGPDHRLALATFDQDVIPIFDGRAGDFDGRVLETVRRRRALGASDLGRALSWAAQSWAAQSRAAGSRGTGRVVLLSDGVVTGGLEGAPLFDAATSLRRVGVQRLDAVAFGGLRDRDTLRSLVTAGLDRDGVVIDGSATPSEVVRRLERTTRSDLAVHVAGARWWWPQRIDGAQPGDTFFVYAEASGTEAPKVSVGGQPVSDLNFVSAERPLVARAWARGKIASAMERIHRAGETPALRREVIRLSTEHRVMSPFTSLLVLETERDYDRFGLARTALADILTVAGGRLTVASRSALPATAAPNRAEPTKLRSRDERDRIGDRAPAPPPASTASSGVGGSGVDEGNGNGSGGITAGPIGGGNLGVIGHGRGAASNAGGRRGHASSPVPAHAAPPRVRMGATVVQGRTSPAVIQRVVRRSYGQLRRCYEAALRGNRQLAGRLDVQFLIAASGKVTSARALGSAFDETMRACVASVFRALRFPGQHVGTVTVRYPLHFTASGEVHLERRRSPFPSERLPRPAHDDDPGPRDARPYRGRLQRIMSAIAEGSVVSALADAEAWQTAAPGDVLALVALGEALEAAARPRDAARAYGSIIDLFPSRADLRRFASGRLERIDHPRALAVATESYRHARDQRPDHPTSHRLLAYAQLKRDRPAAAFASLEAGLWACTGRFRGAATILRRDLALVATAWRRDHPDAGAIIDAKLARHRVSPETTPSLRFVLSWETDTNDVDLHLFDAEGDHAWYASPHLRTGGTLSGDVTTGYGPEMFFVPGSRRAKGYRLQAQYYARGPMGYGMGKVQIIAHDGHGRLRFDERPFVVMVDRGWVDLGTYGAWTPALKG